jgi:hypothetical protein
MVTRNSYLPGAWRAIAPAKWGLPAIRTASTTPYRSIVDNDGSLTIHPFVLSLYLKQAFLDSCTVRSEQSVYSFCHSEAVSAIHYCNTLRIPHQQTPRFDHTMGAALDTFVSYLRIPLLASSGLAALCSGLLYFKQKYVSLHVWGSCPLT